VQAQQLRHFGRGPGGTGPGQLEINSVSSVIAESLQNGQARPAFTGLTLGSFHNLEWYRATPSFLDPDVYFRHPDAL